MDKRSHIGRAVPKQRRSLDNYIRILNASGTLFDRHGLHGPKMSEIADLADVSIGSLYHLFADRHEIAAAIVSRFKRDLIANSGQVPPVYSVGDLEPAIRYAVMSSVEAHQAHPGFLAVVRAYPPFDSESPIAEVNKLIVDFYLSVLSPLRLDAHLPTLRRVVTNCIEVAWFLQINLAEDQEERRKQMEEISTMTSAYLVHRINSLVNAPRAAQQ